MTQSAVFFIFPALMVFAASYDCLAMTISNRLCLVIAAAFFPSAIVAGFGGETIALHAACGLAMLALGFLLFARGWIGGGDAKLFAAAALWFGWDATLDFGIATAIAGGLLATAILGMCEIARYFPAATLIRFPSRPEMPYGVALAAGALFTYPHTQWVQLLS
ncbi:MAG: peptidase [Rhodomicrobium sp.]|nr:peptidase [Rhodomicrobium sp.]